MVVAVIIALGTACGDGPTAPEPGAIRVTISTTGGDRDEDGYAIMVGNDRRELVSTDGAKILHGVSAGAHAIRLEDIADNCAVSGANPVPVILAAGSSAEVEFAVVCDATGIAVTVVTGGVDAPQSFQVHVGALPTHAVAPNHTVLVSRLEPGAYTVELSGVVDGCMLNSDAQVTVDVTYRTVTPVTFDVTCNSLTGVVQVTVVTSGADRDPNGYTVVTTGGWQSPAPVNGVVTFQPMPAGEHILRLSGVASNCLPDGDERTVTVTAGGVIRDTAHTAFTVGCVRTQKIAFQSGNSMIVAYADGSNRVALGTGHGPAWSPDGTQLIYSTLECDYYDYGACSGGLHVIDPETRHVTSLPNGAAGYSPAWSPDGERIAFIAVLPDGTRQLAIIEGSSARYSPITTGMLVSWPSAPSWSPDGQRLVFGCNVGGGQQSDICLVNRNGTGFMRLTEGVGSNHEPAWSPDGSRIVFVTSRFSGQQDLAFMAPDGTGVTRLTTGHSPAWSADGSKVLFAHFGDITVINPDGTGRTVLAAGSYFAPAWRP